MKLDDNVINLVNNCVKNIKSFTRKEDILKYLPVENKLFKIFFRESKLYFIFKNKISYIYLKNNYFSNIEIMKRVGVIFGIKLEKEDIFSITKFCLNINQLLNKGEIEYV